MREMKDSCIQWIGEIPKDWKIIPVKHFFHIGRGRVISVLDLVENGKYPVYSSQTDNDGCFGYLDTYDYFGPAITWTTDGAKAGTFFFRNGKYNCTNVCGILGFKSGESEKNNIRFMTYSIGMTAEQNKRKDINGYKIMSNEMANLRIVLPPFNEQNAIASFLDTKCAEIDSISEDIRKEIETLQEYRKSVITEAVTKGLDPNVEMKDSGTCSIGLIPASWTACKALYCLSMPITDGPHTTPELYDDGIPFVSAEAVSCGNGSIDFNHIRGYISKEFYEECCQKYVPQIDDVYMIKSGATTGRVSIVDTNQIFTIWSPLAVFRVNKSKMLARYLFYMLQSKSVLEQVELSWSFGTQQNIGMRVLERLIVTRPKIDEQKQIVAYLNDKCSEIDSIIADKQKQLEILAEYRKSLIYEYVTGKKEVPTA